MPVVSASVPASDERRHPAARSPEWAECWGFDWGLPDGSLGGFVQFVVFPRRSQAWFWAAVVGPGRDYVLCRDHDLAPPSNPDVLEIRGSSLWAHAICETPLEHWTVAMEAYAVLLDDPYEAWRSERGERIGLAFDLEWEMTDTPTREGDRYTLPCEVHGDVQVGDEAWTGLAAVGTRVHWWGAPSWGGGASGATGDGWHAMVDAPLLLDGGRRLLRRFGLSRDNAVSWRETVPGHLPEHLP